MPSTQITVRRALSQDERRDLIHAVHSAMLSVLGIPDWSNWIRVHEMDTDTFLVNGDVTSRLTLVEISIFEGRSADTKRRLYRAIVDNLDRIGISPTEIKIALTETRRENWGIRGGQMASDVNLGYSIAA